MDFFRIPLHSTHLYDVTFSRHKYVDTLDISTDTSTVSGQYFKLHTQSVQSEDGFYFVFDAHVDSYVPTSNTVDTDQIKGGFGIYKLPYTKESWKNDVDITFETVFKLDPDNYILELEISSDGRQLYLFTYEDGMLTVTVIDTATYAEVQKIPVCSMKSHRTDLMYVLRDDYIAAMVDNSYAEQTMYLLSRDADGKLTLDFAADLNKYGESVAQKYSEEIRWEYITDLSVGYDGSRLVLCRPAYDSRSTYIEMLVYTKDGLQYCGRYTLSLGNRLPDDQYIPFFFDGKFVDISFE